MSIKRREIPADNVRAGPESWAAIRFRELRKEHGWSQQDIAHRIKAFGCSWSQATVTRLEAATRPLSLNEMAALAALYGLTPGEFLDGVPARQPDCPRCGEHGPPQGFTCNTCGRSGS